MSAELTEMMQTLARDAQASLASRTPSHEAISRLEQLARAHRLAVLLADNTGRYIGANTAAAQLTGYSRTELLSLSVFDVTPAGDEKDNALLWRAFLRIGRQAGEIVLRRKDGSLVTGSYIAATHLIPGVHVSIIRTAD
jgi:PAS domain S-box-containing protein